MLEREEIDTTGAGRPDIVRFFQGGRLVQEAHDTNDDGHPDVWITYGPGGEKLTQEEDQDHDGTVDVRFHFAPGMPVRKEILRSSAPRVVPPPQEERRP